jgi:hypothetical protein
MRKISKLFIIFLCVMFCSDTGCTVHTHVLDLRRFEQPIQMGALNIAQTDSQSQHIASYQTISGNLIHEIDEGATSSDENSSLKIGGGEYAQKTLFSEIESTLQNHPDRFIADLQMSVEVKHGISVGTFFASFLSSLITDDDSEIGQFTTEKFYFSGKTYEIEKKTRDE